ncbi:hypothetical protein LTR95_018849 [Oleoguttula sp. CCFEE 5521]
MATKVYGLLELTPPRAAIVDIIFVHGLTGDRTETWTHPKTENFWPQHYLPYRFQETRIFTHGYNADVHSKGTGVIRDFAHDLIHDVLGRRARDGTLRRPLIFIAHSLGGLGVKQAILTCLEDDAPSEFTSITACLLGIIFMGTPHQGAQVAIWGSLLVRPASFFASFNSRILQELRSDEAGLVELQEGFVDVRLRVFCFLEENVYFRGRKVTQQAGTTSCSHMLTPRRLSTMSPQSFRHAHTIENSYMPTTWI